LRVGRRLEWAGGAAGPRSAARRGLKPQGVTFVRRAMPDTLSIGSLPSVFSPLAKALLDGFSEGVIVFDADGKLLYANHQAREALAGMDLSDAGSDLQPRLAAMGGRLRPLRVGALELGEAMFIPGIEGPTTLAAREKEAIVKTLDAHNWKLAETARHLGISRTTLWRRLKAYGLHRDGRSKWAQIT
jgi:transcriptional regulator of acetoin/glycerol metabolism